MRSGRGSDSDESAHTCKEQDQSDEEVVHGKHLCLDAVHPDQRAKGKKARANKPSPDAWAVEWGASSGFANGRNMRVECKPCVPAHNGQEV